MEISFVELGKNRETIITTTTSTIKRTNGEEGVVASTNSVNLGATEAGVSEGCFRYGTVMPIWDHFYIISSALSCSWVGLGGFFLSCRGKKMRLRVAEDLIINKTHTIGWGGGGGLAQIWFSFSGCLFESGIFLIFSIDKWQEVLFVIYILLKL